MGFFMYFKVKIHPLKLTAFDGGNFVTSVNANFSADIKDWD